MSPPRKARSKRPKPVPRRQRCAVVGFEVPRPRKSEGLVQKPAVACPAAQECRGGRACFPGAVKSRGSCQSRGQKKARIASGF